MKRKTGTKKELLFPSVHVYQKYKEDRQTNKILLLYTAFLTVSMQAEILHVVHGFTSRIAISIYFYLSDFKARKDSPQHKINVAIVLLSLHQVFSGDPLQQLDGMSVFSLS